MPQGAGMVARLVKSLFAMLASHFSVPVSVPACSTSDPASCQCTWEGSRRRFKCLGSHHLYGSLGWLPGSWLQPGPDSSRYYHLESEPADRRFSLPPSFPLSLSLANKNKSLKRNTKKPDDLNWTPACWGKLPPTKNKPCETEPVKILHCGSSELHSTRNKSAISSSPESPSWLSCCPSTASAKPSVSSKERHTEPGLFRDNVMKGLAQLQVGSLTGTRAEG